MFEALARQPFRRYFQPSRIVIAVLADPSLGRENLITLCFDMYCSYKPPMMAFAVQNRAYTFSLVKQATECVLGVPGERLADAAMLCGTRSGRECDKVAESGLSLINSELVAVRGIKECIANIEMRIRNKVETGDHILVVGEILRFGVDRDKRERCLLSVGPEHSGYDVIAHQGVHRIGVVRG